MNLDAQALGILAGVLTSLFLVNVGALLGAYISIRVRLSIVEVKVDNLGNNINGVGGKVRKLETETNFKRSA